MVYIYVVIHVVSTVQITTMSHSTYVYTDTKSDRAFSKCHWEISERNCTTAICGYSGKLYN